MTFIPAPAIDAMLWRGYRAAGRPVRLAVVVENWTVPNWMFEAIGVLAGQRGLELVSILRLEVTTLSNFSRASPLFEFLHRQSRKVSDAESPLLDLRSRFAGRSCLSLPVGADGSLTLESRERISSISVDVLIRFDGRVLSGESAGLARFGVWSIHLGDPSEPGQFQPYWREIRDEKPVSEIALIAHPHRLETGNKFYCYAAPTQQGWCFTRNASELFAMAGVILADRLLAIASSSYNSVVCGGNGFVLPNTLADAPGTAEALRFAAQQARRSILRRIRARGREMGWFVALRNDQSRFTRTTSHFNPAGFLDVPLPSGSCYADPFLIEWAGHDYLLVEEIPAGTGRGRLAIMEIGAGGDTGPPDIVLEKPYHLSYPFVLRQGNDIFLLPESAADRTVQLYRAQGSLLNEWRLERILFQGAMLVDTTPFHHDGLWYFFTTQVDYGMRTLLFYATALDSAWIYHPRNPICSDASRARSAGALFYRNGRLIRPSQDCSIRYGHAIVLNEIGKLSPREYEEEIVEKIEPSVWRKGILGTHTLNSNDRWEAIDGLRFMQ
jgi:hypothetical protein